MIVEQVVAEHKSGKNKGIPSYCSSNPWVIRAALTCQEEVLIEATCNQVNQYGGYSGMTPAQYVAYVKRLAHENHFPFEKIVLGGDHLGPNVWQNEPASAALEKSEILVRNYVKAGFTKIHLDCSMRLADDPPGVLDPEVSAIRTARLVRVSEKSIHMNSQYPVYVIGTEVPKPGGALAADSNIHISNVEDVNQTIELSRQAFFKEGLYSAWDRVVAIVVQPGVEYGDDFVIPYRRDLAKDLICFIEQQVFIYEAHSTDYQSGDQLSNLVKDHFAVLKVGPALTFAFREAVFSLALIENELLPEDSRSNLISIIDQEMVKNPEYWLKHFSGDTRRVALSRKYSLSDRIRYYWNMPSVHFSFERLMNNLANISIPHSLLRQYGLAQNRNGFSEQTQLTPELIILGKINEVVSDYMIACNC